MLQSLYSTLPAAHTGRSHSAECIRTPVARALKCATIPSCNNRRRLSCHPSHRRSTPNNQWTTSPLVRRLRTVRFTKAAMHPPQDSDSDAARAIAAADDEESAAALLEVGRPTHPHYHVIR